MHCHICCFLESQIIWNDKNKPSRIFCYVWLKPVNYFPWNWKNGICLRWSTVQKIFALNENSQFNPACLALCEYCVLLPDFKIFWIILRHRHSFGWGTGNRAQATPGDLRSKWYCSLWKFRNQLVHLTTRPGTVLSLDTVLVPPNWPKSFFDYQTSQPVNISQPKWITALRAHQCPLNHNLPFECPCINQILGQHRFDDFCIKLHGGVDVLVSANAKKPCETGIVKWGQCYNQMLLAIKT